MSAFGIIPARYASTRFPGKVLTPIHGYPMVHHVYQRAKACRLLDDVVIATDAPEVARVCATLGDRVMLTTSDHASGTDRVADVVRILEIETDLVINIQGDEPQLDPGIVDDLVGHMEAHPQLNMGTLGSTILEEAEWPDPNVVKVIARDDVAVGFYRTLPPEPPEGTLLRHIGIYAYRPAFLQTFAAAPPSASEKEQRLEQLRAVDMGETIGLVKVAYGALAVDTPEDLKKVLDNWQPFNAA